MWTPTSSRQYLLSSPQQNVQLETNFYYEKRCNARSVVESRFDILQFTHHFPSYSVIPWNWANSDIPRREAAMSRCVLQKENRSARTSYQNYGNKEGKRYGHCGRVQSGVRQRMQALNENHPQWTETVTRLISPLLPVGCGTYWYIVTHSFVSLH